MAQTEPTTPQSLKGKLLKSDKIIFTFLRSIVSSQAASIVDMAVRFVLFAWIHLFAWLSTAIGATCGGIVNCIINYRFTFRAQGCSRKAVAVKYALVWFGSLTLNAVGTEGLFTLMNSWHWLANLHWFKENGIYMTASVIVSLLVSWFWNFILQRSFVYRPTYFDPHAIKIFDTLLYHKKS